MTLKISVLGFGITFKEKIQRGSIAKLKASFYKDNHGNIVDITTVKYFTCQAEKDRNRPLEIDLLLTNQYELQNEFMLIEHERTDLIKDFYVRLHIEEYQR